jgi:hypothetical protein
MNLSEQARQMRADAAALVKEAQGSTAERLPVPQPAPTGANGGAASAGPASAGIGSGIVARLAAVGSGAMARAAEIATGGAASAPEETPSARRHLPQECIVNVACLPAHDEADEIVCLMLVQLLELQGYCATAASVTALASEMMEHVEKTAAQLVCVSAMPPAAVTHARYLCKRVHQRFPELKMVVGLWTWKGDLEKAADRITCQTSVTVHTTLHEALDQLEQLTQPLLLPAEQRSAPAEQSPAPADRSPAAPAAAK